VKVIPERHGQTDGQTTYCGITALCVVSRGRLKTEIGLLSNRPAVRDPQTDSERVKGQI